MQHLSLRLMAMALPAAILACAPPAPTRSIPRSATPGQAARQMALQRVAAVVISDRASLPNRNGSVLEMAHAAEDTDGGSATPITHDGYFLTADHVLAQSAGRHVFVLYGTGSHRRTAKARIVWRTLKGDLALLHAPVSTPAHYAWTPATEWLPAGTPVIHGGVSTGFRTPPGKLTSDLSPQGPFTGIRAFKIDMPLQPGDSGGPVLDATGRLVGVNSAVEFLVPMETAFFIDSEGNRPNLGKIQAIIERDRANPAGQR
jgi:S1-C subfamily serine protease